MGAKGNQFWKARSKHGVDPKYGDPDILWEACQEYFQWVEDNPLYEERAAQYQGAFVKDNVAKMRAMTITGLCIYLNICTKTWHTYRKKEGLLHIVKRVEDIIYTQKLEGSAADLLNSNIIARDLGLAEKSESKVKITDSLTNDQLDTRIEAILNGSGAKA